MYAKNKSSYLQKWFWLTIAILKTRSGVKDHSPGIIIRKKTKHSVGRTQNLEMLLGNLNRYTRGPFAIVAILPQKL